MICNARYFSVLREQKKGVTYNLLGKPNGARTGITGQLPLLALRRQFAPGCSPVGAQAGAHQSTICKRMRRCWAGTTSRLSQKYIAENLPSGLNSAGIES